MAAREWGFFLLARARDPAAGNGGHRCRREETDPRRDHDHGGRRGDAASRSSRLLQGAGRLQRERQLLGQRAASPSRRSWSSRSWLMASCSSSLTKFANVQLPEPGRRVHLGSDLPRARILRRPVRGGLVDQEQGWPRLRDRVLARSWSAASRSLVGAVLPPREASRRLPERRAAGSPGGTAHRLIDAMTGDVIAGEVSRLGWRAQRRPRPGFAHVLGAAAGAFAVVAVVAFVVEVDERRPDAARRRVHAAASPSWHSSLGFFVPGPDPLGVRHRAGAHDPARLGLRAARRRRRRSRRRPRHLPAHARVLPGALPRGLDEGARDLPRRRAPVLRDLGDVRSRGERQQQPHPVPEPGQRAAAPTPTVRHLDRHRRRSRTPTTPATPPPRWRSSSGSCSSAWARCSTGASSKARPLRSSRSARSRRSSARWCSAATRARSWAACSRSRPARSSASSARAATDGARPPGSACSWCSVGSSRCSSTSRRAAPGASARSRSASPSCSACIAWWLAPVLGEPDDGDDRPRPSHAHAARWRHAAVAGRSRGLTPAIHGRDFLAQRNSRAH